MVEIYVGLTLSSISTSSCSFSVYMSSTSMAVEKYFVIYFCKRFQWEEIVYVYKTICYLQADSSLFQTFD